MTTYQHFTPTMTREQIREQYHRLAKLLHPDVGGCTADMQQLNAEYSWAIDKATRGEMPNRSDNSYAHQAQTNERIRQAIEIALRFRHLTVEVCGWWVWVTGTAKGDPANETLKAAGYRWAHRKQAWYFAGIPAKNKREESMEYIRQHHGSETVKADADGVVAEIS